MLKITPNRLTLLRIFLLPVPCLLLFGGPESKLTAVGLGSLLGLTDFLDGRLARRQGSTPLGALLDPVADKIFVSVTYLLLNRLEYVPFWPVALLILREILVSLARSLFPEKLKVWSLARVKTTFQMLGAGIIILAGGFSPTWGEPLIQGTLGSVVFLTWVSAWPYAQVFPSLFRKAQPGTLLGGLLLPLGLLLLFPWSGRLWPLVLVSLGLYFLVETLWSYRRRS